MLHLPELAGPGKYSRDPGIDPVRKTSIVAKQREADLYPGLRYRPRGRCIGGTQGTVVFLNNSCQYEVLTEVCTDEECKLKLLLRLGLIYFITFHVLFLIDLFGEWYEEVVCWL